MTPLDEQARALTNKLDQLFRQRNRGTEKDVERLLSAAICQQWEQAAKEIENTKAFVDSGCLLPCGSILADLIRWCRQRAKGER